MLQLESPENDASDTRHIRQCTCLLIEVQRRRAANAKELADKDNDMFTIRLTIAAIVDVHRRVDLESPLQLANFLKVRRVRRKIGDQSASELVDIRTAATRCVPQLVHALHVLPGFQSENGHSLP